MARQRFRDQVVLITGECHHAVCQRRANRDGDRPPQLGDASNHCPRRYQQNQSD